jgi:adenosylcobyric acid synthase
MAFARHASAPCLFVGDINRGVYFHQLLVRGGCWKKLIAISERLLSTSFREIHPCLKRRSILEQRSQGIPVLGVLPWLEKRSLPDEDAASFSSDTIVIQTRNSLRDSVPHISNFDEFDPLVFETGISLRLYHNPGELINAAAILLPGTKNTLEDLFG